MSQSLIGVRKLELDTPVLCIDLDKMQANIRKMADYCKAHKLQWRPHAKCHKTPAIALEEIRAGAIGVTCAKVSEAEVLAAGGVRDILIANMIVGQRKWERVAALTRWADPIVACDHFAQIEPLAAVCKQRGTSVRVVIEVNIGLDRVGSRPGTDTVDLAKAISKLEGVKFSGIMGYEGQTLLIADQAEKEKKIRESINLLIECRDGILKAGLPCDIVSAGGTGSYQITAKCPGLTELQAGGGIFMDPFYSKKCNVTGLDYALTVLATVVSRPARDKAVLDSGRKTMNPDNAMPIVPSLPDSEFIRFSAEHAEIRLGPQSQDIKIGDKVEVVVGYGDFTTILHENYYGFRGDRLEVVWPILGRGKIQ